MQSVTCNTRACTSILWHLKQTLASSAKQMLVVVGIVFLVPSLGRDFPEEGFFSFLLLFLLQWLHLCLQWTRFVQLHFPPPSYFSCCFSLHFLLQCKESIWLLPVHNPSWCTPRNGCPPQYLLLTLMRCMMSFLSLLLGCSPNLFVLWSLVVIVGSWEGRGLMDVHVAMLSGCMGSCVK